MIIILFKHCFRFWHLRISVDVLAWWSNLSILLEFEWASLTFEKCLLGFWSKIFLKLLLALVHSSWIQCFNGLLVIVIVFIVPSFIKIPSTSVEHSMHPTFSTYSTWFANCYEFVMKGGNQFHSSSQFL